MSLATLGISLFGVLAYIAVYLVKRKAVANLGVIFLLFMAGPAIDESFKIGAIFKQSLIEGVAVNFGALHDHQFIVAFGAVALLWSVAYLYEEVFTSI